MALRMRGSVKPAGAARPAQRVRSSKHAFGNTAGFAAPVRGGVAQPHALEVSANLKELRDRIGSVKNTKKITDAMKLVAAAKVRRAQTAVIGGRPFSENLVKVLYAVNTKLNGEDIDVPLCEVRPVKSVALVVCTGDRGLCGGFNNFMIKKTEVRVAELKAMGIEAQLVLIGKKGCTYFNRRKDEYNIMATFEMGQAPTTNEAQAISDQLYASFTTGEVDKVELVYSKFITLINSKPTVQTLLPLTPEGVVCDVDGNCVDAAEDEVFVLTSQDGQFAVEREATESGVAPLEGIITFEQDPNQVLDALLPLYMNSQILRALQESIASELAARMQAMNNASDNAKDLSKSLSTVYNRMRQSKITNEIIELVAGAAAL